VKVFFRRIHLYLSLAAGLVIMITCLTGAILVFEHELQQLFHSKRYHVEVSGQRLPLQLLVENVKKEIGKGKINSVKVYEDPARSVEVAYSPKKEERRIAFIDPYSGKVIELYNHRESFFYWVMDVHRWMLGGDTGKLIVGIATLIFLFILITGFILWWPKTRNILRQRLKLKLDGGWKRVNHDLHIVLGFYSCIFLFIFAFTGLAWSFKWFNEGIYKVTGSVMKPAEAPAVDYIDGAEKINYDQALAAVTSVEPGALFYNISSPKDSVSAYSVNVLGSDAVHETATDTYYVDPYKGKINGTLKWEERNVGQRVRATFKPVHISSIYGLPSKIIGLIVCLFGASFPITGVIMWLNRIKKKAPVVTKSIKETESTVL
jgi:uncharacterized iron-regulated membrane protein